MASQFIGSMMSIDCGDILGTYQGLLDEVNTSTQALTIVNAFHNGIRCQVPRITISAADILSLKMIKDADEIQGSVPVNKGQTATAAFSSGATAASHKFVGTVSSGPAHGTTADGYGGCDASAGTNVSSCKNAGYQADSKLQQQVQSGNVMAKSCSAGNLSARAGNGNMVHRGSPNRHANGNDFARLHPGAKPNMIGYKHSSSPIEVAVAGSPSKNVFGTSGTRTRENYPTGNHQLDYNHRQATSASELYPVQKNGMKASNIKFNDRHAPGNGFVKEEGWSQLPVESYGADEFDFEKNLALFDKQAVFHEIEREMEQSGTSAVASRPVETKYRCDKNVLPTMKAVYRQIAVGQESNVETLASCEYVTDAGLVVPSVSLSLRQKIFELAEQRGYSKERRIEMIGRSAVEMLMQLLGGGSRFDPKNTHQRPHVVMLCGSGRQSLIAVNCARHLVSRNIRVTVLLPDAVVPANEIETELKLIDGATSFKKTYNCKNLPRTPVDMIISALHGDTTDNLEKTSWYQEAAEWANQNKAPVLAIDPPPGKVLSIVAKWSLAVALPLTYDESCGQIYLCDLGLSQRIYHDAGMVAYQSPFAHKFVMPIYLS